MKKLKELDNFKDVETVELNLKETENNSKFNINEWINSEKANNKKGKAITIYLSANINNELEYIMEKTNKTKGQIISKAIELLAKEIK